MTKGTLSPEDRALHDAFFDAYREKFNELNASANGADVSLDACTVHAIDAMVQRAHDKWSEAWGPIAEEIADELAGLQALDAIECPEDFVNAHGRILFGRAAKAIRRMLNDGPEATPEPRIVSAVGVGVRVKPPENAAPVCELCGEPMPEGETVFKFHGYSGPCPKPEGGA